MHFHERKMILIAMKICNCGIVERRLELFDDADWIFGVKHFLKQILATTQNVR
jgi:hypothetical protein